MSLMFDGMAAKQRHEEMLREASDARRARQVAKANGAESLFSRMVKLLSRSNHPVQGGVEGPLNQRPLAQVKGR